MLKMCELENIGPETTKFFSDAIAWQIEDVISEMLTEACETITNFSSEKEGLKGSELSEVLSKANKATGYLDELFPGFIDGDGAVMYLEALYAAARSKHMIVPDIVMMYAIWNLAEGYSDLAVDSLEYWARNSARHHGAVGLHGCMRVVTVASTIRTASAQAISELAKYYGNAAEYHFEDDGEANYTTVGVLEALTLSRNFLDLIYPDYDFMQLDSIADITDEVAAGMGMQFELADISKLPVEWATDDSFYYDLDYPCIGECEKQPMEQKQPKRPKKAGNRKK